jgi:hypothetical protein
MTITMPIHPFTGLTALGLRRDGRPIWPVMGGDGTTDPSTPPAPAPVPAPPAPVVPPADPAPIPPAPPPKPEDGLGEAGKKALAEERAARQALQKRFDKLAEALGDGDKAKGKTDIELLNDKFGAYEQQLAAEREARFRAEVAQEKGLTAKQAARLKGATRDDLLADADDLLASFPAAAAPQADPAKPPTPAPDPSQGNRNSPPPRPKSLTEAVAEAMKAK